TVTFEVLGFNEPAMVSGADGTLHVVFTSGPTPTSAFQYARCSQDCGVSGNWTITTIDSGQALKNRARLVIGTDNRLHALYETQESGGTQTIYSTCAANCTQAGSWSRTDLTSLLDGSAPWRGAPMVIDSQNRVYFIVSHLTFNPKVTIATCASGCDTLSNWTTGVFRQGGSRTAMAARGTTLHAIMHNENNELVYRTCTGNCTVTSNWQESPPLFVFNSYQPTAIAVTAQGGVRVAYNQGNGGSSDPQIMAQDYRLLVWSCDANCMDPTSWNGVILGDANEGTEGLSLVEAGGGLVLLSTNETTATVHVCSSGCTNNANWQRGVVDSSEAFRLAYDPVTYGSSGCSPGPASFAAWYLDDGIAALRPDGSAAFVFGSHMLRKCYPTQDMATWLPGFGRLAYVP
ncbi:MAG: hypothetical protein AB1938_13710, partial [Myxococcota bacterium]